MQLQHCYNMLLRAYTIQKRHATFVWNRQHWNNTSKHKCHLYYRTNRVKIYSNKTRDILLVDNAIMQENFKNYLNF